MALNTDMSESSGLMGDTIPVVKKKKKSSEKAWNVSVHCSLTPSTEANMTSLLRRVTVREKKQKKKQHGSSRR